MDVDRSAGAARDWLRCAGRGWDAVDQELELGRRSSAAPVFDSEGRAVAALSLSCGTRPCSMEHLPHLRTTARAVSEPRGAGAAARLNTRENPRRTDRR
ncbi:IclR family transcriptional regulator C-terminal domain-containing protein [Streptomyces sp. LUP47B]|uniref:IclR family transcriptional regulator domain-containing protein n=1 Tax=Streptomyces sp. LUP47B TaxID=1890286 RepID=UPI0009A09DBD|nr:IclR family transcriptional regulator C-terminal domain-containing protein [Streptomyces sp. LUP47B]